LLASWISAESGVSSFFQGGVVSYARAVKENSLGVPSTLISAHGQVSLPVALSMARGVRVNLEADWGLSITGVAGPSGGTPEKPVGYVCFAAVGPGFERAVQQQFDAHGGRQDIQRQAALFAFDLLINAMR
jgi:nicotinamide-nucleotide amidase